MNVKLITRALHTLSLLSDEDYDLVLKLRALTEDERGMLTLVLEPSKPAGKKAGKSTPRKIQHCAVCNWTKRAALHKDTTRDDYHEFVLSLPEPNKPNGKPASKSPRATGIERQLNKRREQGREVVTTKDDNYDPEVERCTFPRDDGKLCFLLPDHNVHHMKSAQGFHPFQSSFDVSSADTRSPANDASSASERSTRRSVPPSTPESDGESRSALSSTVGSEDAVESATNASSVAGD